VALKNGNGPEQMVVAPKERGVGLSGEQDYWALSMIDCLNDRLGYGQVKITFLRTLSYVDSFHMV
jgi:hypothetical protein